MFSCGFCEISKNTFITEHLRATTSEVLMNVMVGWYGLYIMVDDFGQAHH